MINFKKKKRLTKGFIITLEALAIIVIVYLVALPFYPALKYKLDFNKNENIDFTNINQIKKITEQKLAILPQSEKIINTTPSPDTTSGNTENKNPKATSTENNTQAIDNKEEESNNSETPEKVATQTSQPPIIPNTLIIPKIGVDIKIIGGEDENYGLDRGSWKLPKSSTPDETGNMILTGHRFKYLPPSNTTFYLFHKLEVGDIASVIWNNESYYYKIKEIKIVSGDDISILKQTNTSTLTMYTCDPIYSTENRLVVIADLIEE